MAYVGEKMEFGFVHPEALFLEALAFAFCFLRIFLRCGISCLKARFSPKLLQFDLIFTGSWKLIHNVPLLPCYAPNI